MPAAPTTTLVVAGVSGSGKTTVARAVAERRGWTFAEGDEFHPASSIAAMRAGVALTDEQRAPWLAALAAWIGDREGARESAVLTCSALRRVYRDVLRRGHPSVFFVHLDVPREVLQRRLRERSGHFMPASLLDSQLALLEPLGEGEPGMTARGDADEAAVVAAVLEGLPKFR